MNGSKICKLNNKGAAMVIAVIVVAFVSILTTILLYLANMNYQMKSTDFKTKVSFYGAEEPLEGIRAQLMYDVSQASDYAYKKVVSTYGSSDEAGRALNYQNEFVTEFERLWETRTTDPDDPSITWNWTQGTKEALGFTAIDISQVHIILDDEWDGSMCTDPAVSNCECPYHILLETGLEAPDTDEEALDGENRLIKVTETIDEGGGVTTTKIHFELKGFRVIYTEDNFTSIIDTCYKISIPAIDWSVEKYVDDWTAEDTENGSHERVEVNMEDNVVYLDWIKQ